MIKTCGILRLLILKHYIYLYEDYLMINVYYNVICMKDYLIINVYIVICLCNTFYVPIVICWLDIFLVKLINNNKYIYVIKWWCKSFYLMVKW